MGMTWLLLNQLFVNLDYNDCKISVLEEVIFSEQQLVQVLASGRISSRTMSSVYPHVLWNPIGRTGHSLV